MSVLSLGEIPKPSQNPTLAISVAELLIMELKGESYPEPERLRSELVFLEGMFTVAAAYEGNQVVATASMRPRQFNPEEAIVSGVVAVEKERKKGLGRRVINFLEELAREREIKKLRLISSPAATTFYDHLGYQKMYQYNDGSSDFFKNL